MSPSSPHSRSSGQAIKQEVGDLAAVVPVANPIKCLSFVRCQGQGIHGCVSRSGVLRIVLRTPVGGVSQPSESSDSVPCHNSTSRIVAWYLASRSPSRATC